MTQHTTTPSDGIRAHRAAYARRRHRAIAYGTWQPWTDAEPVRAHVRALQDAGIGTMAIAALAGVHRQNIQFLMAGRGAQAAPERIRTETARRILAVRPPTLDELPDTARVNSIGSRRRIQALAAVGWPESHLAARIGVSRAHLRRVFTEPGMYAASARRIRDAYDEMWDADPAAHGVLPGWVTRTRERAAAAGWAPPAAWDDEEIDDPAARPTGVRKASSA